MDPAIISATPTNKPLRIATWAFSVLLGLAFIASALGTLSGGMTAVLHGQLGVPLWAIPIIGAIKLVAAIALFVPAVRFVGAAALLATMAGAVGTHLLAGDLVGAIAPFVLGALAGLIAWWTKPVWVQQRLRGVPA